MRKMLTTLALFGALLVAGGALALGTTQVDLRIVDDGIAVKEAQIELFFSCDKVSGVTDTDGKVQLEADCRAAQYWVEVDGRRIGELYRVDSRTRTIDLSDVTFIEWQGGR